MNVSEQIEPQALAVKPTQWASFYLKTRPLGYIHAMQTVAETSIFQKRAAALLSEDEYGELIAFLAGNPEAGDEIVGTGGVRKVRFAAAGRGKSGGVRVVYYYYAGNAPLYALMIYGKNEKADLSAARIEKRSRHWPPRSRRLQSRESRKGVSIMSDFARELISSMEEALEHAKGGKTGIRIHVVAPVDVKKARKALKMTQPDFARLVGTSVSGLQKWEQGKRQPGGAARTLITLIMRAPEAVREALEEREEKLSA